MINKKEQLAEEIQSLPRTESQTVIDIIHYRPGTISRAYSINIQTHISQGRVSGFWQILKADNGMEWVVAALASWGRDGLGQSPVQHHPPR